jgi:hypothetical protein
VTKEEINKKTKIERNKQKKCLAMDNSKCWTLVAQMSDTISYCTVKYELTRNKVTYYFA